MGTRWANSRRWQGRAITRQPANQPTSQPANQPTSQPANQPTSQPANQPTSQSTAPGQGLLAPWLRLSSRTCIGQHSSARFTQTVLNRRVIQLAVSQSFISSKDRTLANSTRHTQVIPSNGAASLGYTLKSVENAYCFL
ncbi:hypothetical protein C7H73_12595 [Pulveribacter suum]|uniref:Uncharacterized protein n=1 Tax=Pulveribacter suum TaxID=2116657 RepID=A0A2P1NPZ1_9BURK|nr:hypothetical protein C7H73_12595 [Pulveribacter suum]